MMRWVQYLPRLAMTTGPTGLLGIRSAVFGIFDEKQRTDNNRIGTNALVRFGSWVIPTMIGFGDPYRNQFNPRRDRVFLKGNLPLPLPLFCYDDPIRRASRLLQITPGLLGRISAVRRVRSLIRRVALSEGMHDVWMPRT